MIQTEGFVFIGLSISDVSLTYLQFYLDKKKKSFDKHREVNLLPSHKVLQSRLQNCKVGDHIKVVYEKDELPKIRGQNPTRIYKVLKEKPLIEEEVKDED